MSPNSSGGDVPWVFLLLLVLVILAGLTILAVLSLRRRWDERLAHKNRIEWVRATIRQQLDALAHRILKLEDPVRTAGHADALTNFRNATVAYAAIAREFEAGVSDQKLPSLADRLGTAIWQLDAAEAIIDGTPLPQQPVANAAVSRSQPPYRQKQSSGRNGSIGVLDSIVAVLEAGSHAVGPAPERKRRRSRGGHC